MSRSRTSKNTRPLIKPLPLRDRINDDLRHFRYRFRHGLGRHLNDLWSRRVGKGDAHEKILDGRDRYQTGGDHGRHDRANRSEWEVVLLPDERRHSQTLSSPPPDLNPSIQDRVCPPRTLGLRRTSRPICPSGL